MPLESSLEDLDISLNVAPQKLAASSSESMGAKWSSKIGSIGSTKAGTAAKLYPQQMFVLGTKSACDIAGTPVRLELPGAGRCITLADTARSDTSLIG